MSMAWRILVTGATGCLGREIVKRLHQREVDFVAACRQDSVFPEEIRNLTVNYEFPAVLDQAFREIDLLFLLIPFAEDMKQWAKNAIRAAQKAGVKLIVRPSVVGADIESPYLWLRTEGEINQLLQESGIPSVTVRGTGFMQNFQRLYGDALRQGNLFLPEGEGRVAYLDARDLAAVCAEILVNPFHHIGKDYEVTGPRSISNAEALRLLSLAAHRRISYIPVTEEATRKALMKSGASRWWTEFVLSRHLSNRDGVGDLVTSTVKEILKREPMTFEEYCEEVAEEFQGPVQNLRLR